MQFGLPCMAHHLDSLAWSFMCMEFGLPSMLHHLISYGASPRLPCMLHHLISGKRRPGDGRDMGLVNDSMCSADLAGRVCGAEPCACARRSFVLMCAECACARGCVAVWL